MITLYSGTPGSGKSYHAALVAYRALKARRYVVSNAGYVIDNPYLIELEPAELSVSRLEDISASIAQDSGRDRLREGELLLIIDEAQLVFNARSWQANDNKGWLSFFSQHRKLGYNVIMIAQSDRMIDRQIRSLIEYNVVHRRVDRIGIWGWFFRLLKGNFVAVRQWYGIREVVDSEFLRYRRKIARIYDTYRKF